MNDIPKWYLILASAYSLTELILGGLFFSGKDLVLAGIILGYFIMAWVPLNILLLLVFFLKDFQAKAMVLPLLYILDQLLSLLSTFTGLNFTSYAGIILLLIPLITFFLALVCLFPRKDAWGNTN